MSRGRHNPSVMPMAKVSFLGVGRRTSPEARAMIDAAVAAGRVTVIAPGVACGLTAIEEQLWTARPQAPEAVRTAMARGVESNKRRMARARGEL